MATDTKSSSLVKLKASGSSERPSSLLSKNKIDPSKKKLVETSSKTSVSDAKNRSTTNVSKMTKKTTTTTHTKTEVKTVTKTRQKKVYSLAGQKFDVPEEREPLRLFYESLSKQIPSSEMAEFWLMEHGLLSPEKSKKAFEKKQRKQKQIRMGTPVKSPPPYVSNKSNLNKAESSKKPQQVPKKVEVSKKPNNLDKGESSKKPQQQVPKSSEVKAKKRLVSDSDDEDDFVLSHKRRKA